MELSPDKREKYVIPVLEGVNIAVALILLTFYPFITGKALLVLLSVLLFVIVLPQRFRLNNFFRSMVKYAGILVFFLPAAFSLNQGNLLFGHLVVLILLFYPLFLSLRFMRDNPVISREDILFAIFVFAFLVLMILFVYYSPIREEFRIKTETNTVLYKSMYLLFFLFLLIADFRVLESVSHSSFYVLKGTERIISVFLILMISLSLYDNIKLRTVAADCMQRRYSGCRMETDIISGLMYMKGFDSQNISFLQEYIDNGLENSDAGIMRVIESAERMYPYECGFYRSRILYYSRFGMQDRLKEFLENLPAPAKKVCRNLKEVKSGER